jgi:hypothetical protein
VFSGAPEPLLPQQFRRKYFRRNIQYQGRPLVLAALNRGFMVWGRGFGAFVSIP